MTRIAIVEGNRVTRKKLVSSVETDPECECVFACATAKEALKGIPKHQPNIVLMDIQLPDISGIACTARLKQLLPSLHIIMVTVYEDSRRIFQALRAGASGYLLKRCSSEELVAAIHEVEQGGAPMSREIAHKVIASFQKKGRTTTEVEGLSPREREILELLAAGFANKEIAARIGLTERTVRWHLLHVYNKLHVHSRTEAALKYLSDGPERP
jgi:DNA-binding NarL/FixJ family response regulator